MLKRLVVAEVKPGLVNSSEYPNATLSIDISVKFAIPFMAATVVVPEIVAVVVGSLLKLIVTGFVALVTKLLDASLSSTVIFGDMISPLFVFEESCVITNCVGTAIMSKDPLVVVVNPIEFASRV